MQSLAASLGVARIAVFTVNGIAAAATPPTRRTASSGAPLELVEETANLRRDDSRVANLPGGRTAVLTFFVSNQGVDGVVLVEAPLHRRSGAGLGCRAAPRDRRRAGLRRRAPGRRPGSGTARAPARPPARRGRPDRSRLVRGADRGPLARRDRRACALARGDAYPGSSRSSGASAFIANASHELRTPLTALGGYLELLTEGGLTEDERSEFLATMGEQVQRLTKLATDLLDLSRLDAGGFTVAHDEIELGELASDCAREMQALAARRGSLVVVEPGAPGARTRRRGAGAPGPARARRQRRAPYTARLDGHAAHRDDALGRERDRLRRRPGHPAGAARARLRALLPRPGRGRPRYRPRPRDRARAGRAHGRAAARVEQPGGTRFTLELPGPSAEGAPAYTESP